jgi:HSP20 family molecular chaperone IbpA
MPGQARTPRRSPRCALEWCALNDGGSPCSLVTKADASAVQDYGRVAGTRVTGCRNDNKEYLARAELPGVTKEDLKVSLDNGYITIEGTRRQRREDKDEKFHTVECTYGNFSRTFSLPERVRADAIRSEFKDGMLTVHIPRDESPKKPTVITVQ